jgi:hypothetical protein
VGVAAMKELAATARNLARGSGLAAESARVLSQLGTVSRQLLPKYQAFYDDANASIMEQYKAGKITIPNGVPTNTHLGRLIDARARDNMRFALADIGLSESPTADIRLNRRAYDPSGSGRYGVPDVYLKGEKVIFDGTIGNKAVTDAQIQRFFLHTDATKVIIVRPNTPWQVIPRPPSMPLPPPPPFPPVI